MIVVNPTDPSERNTSQKGTFMTVLPDIPSIETNLSTMMHSVLTQVTDGAGLALLRGPAGIGKSYSLNRSRDMLENDGVRVVSITATPAIGGSLGAFVRAILAQYRIEASSTPDGVESLYNQVKGFPFRNYGPRCLFLVDEAQELKTAILESLRGLWDRGDMARLGESNQPAFGLALVGNDTFMGRNGGIHTAYFRPLLSRVTHNVSLPRPNAGELRDLAENLFPDQKALQDMAAAFGEDQGSLRASASAARQARVIAKGETVTEAHLRMAIRMMGGR
ncbi:MAG: ATP-binding protein [Rhodobacteraceae bacterium]|nr:MAG: ATP-binding protein [Paracoccaceae bacterium]